MIVGSWCVVRLRSHSSSASPASSAVDSQSRLRKTAEDAGDAEDFFAGNTLIHHYRRDDLS